MKKLFIPIVCCGMLLSTTSSCILMEWAAVNSNSSNETKGAIIGAGSGARTGAFIGSLVGHGHQRGDNALIGGLIGAVAGAAIGGAVGNSIDKQQTQGTYYSNDASYSSSRVYSPSGGAFYYGQSKTKLEKTVKNELDNVAMKVRTDPTAVAEIYGHSDNTGTDEYRRQVSTQRALEVKKYLMKKGVPESQIYVQGCADKYPAADNSTAEGRAKNRRVEIMVTHYSDSDATAPSTGSTSGAVIE